MNPNIRICGHEIIRTNQNRSNKQTIFGRKIQMVTFVKTYCGTAVSNEIKRMKQTGPSENKKI